MRVTAGNSFEVCFEAGDPARTGRIVLWSLDGVRRVRVHTCELDSEAALSNYRARGFVVCGTSIEHWDTSEPSPGPWRGSR